VSALRRLRVVASIAEAAQIKRILAHRERRAEDDRHAPFASRAPLQTSLL
jgi:hypothetical protein